MKDKMKEAGYFLDGKLRRFCGEITPDKRIILVIVLLLIFTLINLYITFSSVYNFGKNSAGKKAIQIEHISPPEVITPLNVKKEDAKRGIEEKSNQ